MKLVSPLYRRWVRQTVRVKDPSKHFDNIAFEQQVYGKIIDIEKRPTYGVCKKCKGKTCDCNWFIIRAIVPYWIGDSAYHHDEFELVDLDEVEVATLMEM
jgi:hypothetical protein